jgi:methionine salvage enolase-phosphatase E1
MSKIYLFIYLKLELHRQKYFYGSYNAHCNKSYFNIYIINKNVLKIYENIIKNVNITPRFLFFHSRKH